MNCLFYSTEIRRRTVWVNGSKGTGGREPGGGWAEEVGSSYFRNLTAPPALKGHQPLGTFAARDRVRLLPARGDFAPPPRQPRRSPASSALRPGGREADGTCGAARGRSVAGGGAEGGREEARRGQRGGEWAGRGRDREAERLLPGELGLEKPRLSPPPATRGRPRNPRRLPEGPGAFASPRRPARRKAWPCKAAALLGYCSEYKKAFLTTLGPPRPGLQIEGTGLLDAGVHSCRGHSTISVVLAEKRGSRYLLLKNDFT